MTRHRAEQFRIADLAADANAVLPPGTTGLADAAEAVVLLAATHGSRLLRYAVTVARQRGAWVIAAASAVPPYR